MKSQPRDVEAALNLRTFIDRLKQAGKLKELRNAHWDLEIGALTEITAEAEERSALLFDSIPDYPEGYRVLSNVLRSPESDALALGMPSEIRGLDVVQTLKSTAPEPEAHSPRRDRRVAAAGERRLRQRRQRAQVSHSQMARG